MEDIKKAIEEEKSFYRQKVYQERIIDSNSYFDSVDIALAVEYGANFILSKWEESERWRKVEEGLPEDNITVLLEIEYDGVIDYSTGHFYDKGKKSHIDCELYEDAIITRWKPIH